jgi:hypothetical protein
MSFQLAHLRSQSMAHVNERPVAEEEAFQRGALLVEDDYGEYAEATADDYGSVGAIDGIALARYGVDGTLPYEGTPSFDILGGFGFIPGNMQAIQVVHGDRGLMFSAEYVGTLPTTVGGSYGVVRDTDGRWKVDFASDAAVVRLESLAWTQDPINKNRVVVSFLDAEEV